MEKKIWKENVVDFISVNEHESFMEVPRLSPQQLLNWLTPSPIPLFIYSTASTKFPAWQHALLSFLVYFLMSRVLFLHSSRIEKRREHSWVQMASLGTQCSIVSLESCSWNLLHSYLMIPNLQIQFRKHCCPSQFIQQPSIIEIGNLYGTVILFNAL